MPKTDLNPEPNSNSDTSRIVRLLRFIQELHLRPKQTPQELCTRFGIKRSTFHSDKKTLAEAGFKWNYNRRRREYERESEGIIPQLDLTIKEALAMVLAVRQFSASGDYALAFDAVEGVKKLIAAAPASARKLLSGALDDVMRSTFRSSPSIVNALVEAQRSRLYITVLYDDRSRSRVMRYEIAPYQIFFQARALYADCFIPSENRIATLRVSRIKKAEGFGGYFEVSPAYDFAERHRHTFRAIRKDEKPQLVRLRFYREAAQLIWESRWHASERKLECSDGGVILELTVSEPKEVLWYLAMPYAEHVEILEPKWLRTEFLRIAQSVVKRLNANRGRSQNDQHP